MRRKLALVAILVLTCTFSLEAAGKRKAKRRPIVVPKNFDPFGQDTASRELMRQVASVNHYDPDPAIRDLLKATGVADPLDPDPLWREAYRKFAQSLAERRAANPRPIEWKHVKEWQVVTDENGNVKAIPYVDE